METIIQAGHKRLRIVSVPVATNAEDARVAAVHEHLPAHAQVGVGHRAQLPDVQAVRRLRDAGGRVRRRSPSIPFVRFLVLWLSDGDGGGPRPVAHLRRRSWRSRALLSLSRSACCPTCSAPTACCSRTSSSGSRRSSTRGSSSRSTSPAVPVRWSVPGRWASVRPGSP